MIEDSADMAEGEGREPLKTHVTAERKAVINWRTELSLRAKSTFLQSPPKNITMYIANIVTREAPSMKESAIFLPKEEIPLSSCSM